MTLNPTPLLHIGLQAQAHPEQPALIMGTSGETVSYGDLDLHSSRLAAFLRQNGLSHGDHIAILMENSADYLIACWAAQRSGLYFTPVNWHLSSAESAFIINDCGAKCLISSPFLLSKNLGEVDAQTSKVALRLISGPAQGAYQSLHAIYQDASLTALADESEGSSMFYSSGTTGKPKGIKRPLQSLPWGTQPIQDKLLGAVYGFNPSVVLLCPAPLYHAAPLTWCLGAQRLGATVVVMERFDELEALRQIETYRVTHGHFVPTMFVRMLNLPTGQRTGFDLSSLRYVVHAAAPCPLDIKKRMFEWLGPIIYEYYAGSEGNGFCAVNPQEWLAHPGTVGKPLLGQVHILDDEGHELPVGEVGGIFFGNAPTFEYHNDADKTASAYNKQGWSTLGDIGCVDQDGFVYLSDRRTDLIISGGVNIYPRETEDALLQHHQVLDVAVVGAPSADFGEDVVAVIELKAGVLPSEALAAELIAFSRDKIAHFKCPKRVLFAALPRTPTGKLLRRHLKDQLYAAATSWQASHFR